VAGAADAKHSGRVTRRRANISPRLKAPTQCSAGCRDAGGRL